MTAKGAIFIFIVAFLLNTIWETIHSLLYIQYRGGVISEYVLLRAAAFDAAIILLGIFIAQRFFGFHKIQFLLIFWLFVAIIIEWWALATGRWVYSGAMPIVPFLEIGLTPMIQLATLGLFSYLLDKAY